MAEYHVENFGCRASRADGDAIAARLRHAGLSEAADSAAAQVIVLNTCSVTAEAERDARSYLRRALRVNPRARVVMTGCYAQRAPAEVAALDGVSAVVGNSHKSQVAEVALSVGFPEQLPTYDFVPIEKLFSGSSEVTPRIELMGDARSRTQARDSGYSIPVLHDPLFGHADLSVLPFASDSHRTRPNLKVQDGCGNRCSFCIIPVTRGPSRSISLEDAVSATEQFVASGGKELILSGINLGRWGRDWSPAQRFEDLVAAILVRTAIPRLRISSIEPMDWSPELLALFQKYGQEAGGDSSRLARHAHLPLQSGSDTILRRMHRRYRPWHYAAKVEAIHAALPGAAIGADVMIGFPGETEGLFRETYEFIERLPFTYLHIFPFSARPGTSAFELHRATPVHGEAVNERKAALRALIANKNAAFRRQFLGSELPVLTLADVTEKATYALSDNFIKVSVSGIYPANKMLQVRVENVSADGLAGKAISAS